MKQHLLQKLVVVLLMLITVKTYSQNLDTIEIQRNSNGKVSFARFKVNNASIHRTMNDVQFLRDILQVKPFDSLVNIQSDTDQLRIIHKRFQQYYKGVKVENATYLTHRKENSIETINGEFAVINISSTQPSIAEGQALTKAIEYVNAKKYKWEDTALEKFIKKNTNNINATYYPKGELVISRDVLKTGKSWQLAWKFTISALEPNTEQYIYVSAKNGEIINKESLILDTNTPGTAQTRYSGTQNITGDSFVGGFRLRENRNTIDVQTLNMRRTNNYANAVDFVDNDNIWTTAEFANANWDQAAEDAHWGAEAVLDYWRNVHNRNSIDGSGLPIRSYVHFRADVNSNWNNAAWDRTNHVMQYGDGDGFQFSPFTSLDICSHEFGHGICQYTCNLAYQGESGALNEGFSDIWGAAIEFWKAPAKQKWLIGEEIGGPFRSMSNPNAYGQPDTYLGNNWVNQNGCVPSLQNDFCGVHTNSGVLNFWFYLLSTGGIGTNDIGNAYNVASIGITDAARIAYRTEASYLTSSSNYVAVRNASIQAARDLFGGCSSQEIAVTNAWYAVGVGTAYVTLTTPTITATKTSAIGEPTTYGFTANPLISGATYNWYSNNGLTQSATYNTYDDYFPCNVSKTVKCSITKNGCGTSAFSNSITKTGECTRTSTYTLSPNPATNNVTVSASESDTKSTNTTNASIDQIRIYDLRGVLKKYQKFNKVKSATIDITALTNGTYFVEITDGVYKEKQQLLIQK